MPESYGICDAIGCSREATDQIQSEGIDGPIILVLCGKCSKYWEEEK